MRAGIGVAAALLPLALQVPALAQDAGPRPPCGSTSSPVPAPAALQAPPEVAVWTPKTLEDPGLPHIRLHAGVAPEALPPPAACTGWDALPPFTLALSASFRHAGGVDALLARFGAISALEGSTYWAASRGRWEPLFDRAHAVADPDGRAPRPDFAADELRAGRDAFAFQDIGGPVGGAVFRLRAREAGPDRVVVEQENVTSARVAGLFPLRAGTLRSVHFFDRVPGTADEWTYYGLAGLGTAPDSARTYVNRAAGLYRHLAGIPAEREPPVWP